MCKRRRDAGKIPSEKQCILPRGHSVQYPLEGYKSRLSRQAARLGYNLVNLPQRLELEGLKLSDG
jgi:hypothetical protein